MSSSDIIQENIKQTSKDYYFDSYSHFGIHEEMLKDQVRTNAYLKAIEQNKHLIEGKIVLDVGCGTGILSLFCAKFGNAKKVYAVDMSNIAIQCQEIVKENHLEHIIEVFHCKMEEVELPCEYVDIIISEWMGYFLLYESMLPSVLYARDKYLDPKNGMILPDKAILYLTAIEDADYKHDRIDYWDDVYGFNMGAIKKLVLLEPLVDCVESRQIISDNFPILTLDIMTCKVEDLNFTSDFELKFSHNDYAHAIVGYFECYFTQLHKTIIMSTSPYYRQTHWKHTVFYLEEPLIVESNEKLCGSLSVQANSNNHRDLDIRIQTRFRGKRMKNDMDKLFRLR